MTIYADSRVGETYIFGSANGAQYLLQTVPANNGQALPESVLEEIMAILMAGGYMGNAYGNYIAVDNAPTTTKVYPDPPG
jgi:hypothetical protein